MVRDAANGGEFWPLLLLVCPFWSVFVSYRGVRTVFPETKVWATRVWFGVLPVILYAVVMGGIFVWAFIAGYGAAADVKNPRSFSSATMQFDYPGNWDIPGGDDFDPEVSVTVEPVQDAAILFTIYPSNRPHQDEVADTLAAFGETFGQIDEVGEFTQWGGLEGYGKEALAHLKSEVYRTRVFVHSIGEYERLEVREIVLVDDEEKLRPGFDLIASSFQLQGGAPDVEVEAEPPLPTGAPKAPIAP